MADAPDAPFLGALDYVCPVVPRDGSPRAHLLGRIDLCADVGGKVLQARPSPDDVTMGFVHPRKVRNVPEFVNSAYLA